jgi:translocation and assembly module TamA
MWAPLLLLLLTSHAFADVSLCPHVILKDGRLKLTENEKILVCGSRENDSQTPAWSEIPIPQARYEISIILQNHGYLNARFERQAELLLVWMGAQTETKILNVMPSAGTNGPKTPVLDPAKKRKIRGFPLEPAKLDEVANWALLSLRRSGFACPKVSISAQAWLATINAEYESGKVQDVDHIVNSGLDGLDQDTLLRFEAFKSGDRYDIVDVQVTTDRLLSQGLFQSAYYSTECHDDKVDLHLFTTIGKSHLLRFGVGASTEELPFADLWFKNTRLDARASSFTGTLHASPIRQTFNLTSEFYAVPFSRRSFFGPRFKVERLNAPAYETHTAALGADLGRAFDAMKMRLQGLLGPTFNLEQTVRGVGPLESKFLSWDGSLSVMSHAYEAFSRDQYEGFNGSFKYSGRRKGVGSDLNVDRYDVDFKTLWNLGHFSPPIVVFASRVSVSAIDAGGVSTDDQVNALPVADRIFYGGDSNLRGFSRESLGNSGFGYLTALYAGFEARLIEVIPYRIEPFLLCDIAKLGTRPYTLGSPLFYSPGIGVRWVSPFGTLRGSAAKGQIVNGDVSTSPYKQDLVYFVSFGQEF